MQTHAGAVAQSPPDSESSPTAGDDSLRQNYGLLLIACLLAIAGGYLDAYAYLAHGKVFANVQTGNIVFLAVYASDAQWAQAVRHLPPIVTFVLGVAAAWLLGVQTQKQEFHATLLCQALEIVILCGLALLAHALPDPWVVPIISFVSAFQTTSFQKIGPWSFTSTMTTGNLRKATSGLVLWLLGRDPANNRNECIALAAICLAFLTGALGGGIYTRWDKELALLPCVAVVGTGFLLTWRQRHRRVHEPR